jgi:predicted signal transduction protein with EAL and GGDEF domain
MFGDELLVNVGKMLQNRMRSTDTIARFGGDEFVILLDDIREKDNVTQISDWIHSTLSQPFTLSDHQVYISASIGIVLGEPGYQRPEEVLRDADIAMYHAKAKGKARYEVFEASMRTRVLDRLELANDLRHAVENEELRLNYQVIFSLITGKVTGLEALVRWQHPERGLLYPGDFIPLAEETGLIIGIDRWVLREACQQLRNWQQETPLFSPLTISVNLSGRDLSQPDLSEYVESTLKETGLEPNNLSLEITETFIVENKEITINVCNKLRELGIHIQIDDFGSGYSSLSYLSQFPINALKIDQSFIRNMGNGGNDTNIIQAIVMLSRRMGVNVIAEGVETVTQLNTLKELGCEYGQGYYVSKPLMSDDTKALLLKSLQDNISLF